MVSKQIDHAEAGSTEVIKCDYNLAHGMYQPEVTKPDKNINISVLYQIKRLPMIIILMKIKQ
jgi:hypothetical protein